MTQVMLTSMAWVAFAQTDSSLHTSVAYGGALSIAPSIVSAALLLPGFSEECGLLNNGQGISYRGSLMVEFPLSRALALQLRPSATIVETRLQDPIPISLPVARVDGSVVEGAIDQRLDLHRFDVGLGVHLRSPVLSRLSIVAGAMLEHTLSSSATHRQIAITPDDLLLSNNRRELVLDEGDLLDYTPLKVSVEGGASFDLPLAPGATLSPEFLASIPLTSESRNGSLRTISLRMGMSLRFRPPPAAPPPPPPPPPLLATTIRTSPPVVAVTITEYDSTEFLPLLNQVFFSEGSDAIPSRYQLISQEKSVRFDKSDSLLRYGTALDVYYHVLNIVGRRLQEQVGATLTINGYRNSRERDVRLGLRRAEAVRRYLVSVWGINPRRLSVTGNALPPNPAREVSMEGFEENSRVELIASDPNITRPWVRIHTQGIATPSRLVFFPRVESEAGIEGWSLEIVQQESEPWRVISGAGSPPDSIVWSWRSDEGEMPAYPLQLAYRFAVRDRSGQKSTTPFSQINVAYESSRQPLEHRENDSIVDNYSLLLFNFDRPEVTPSDAELLKAISSGIGSGARVRFIGYTDSLGDASHNRVLAAARARDAVRIFRSLVPGDVVIIVDEERGGEWERFPFTTPEGRSHCRTVFIEVRTPVKRDG